LSGKKPIKLRITQRIQKKIDYVTDLNDWICYYCGGDYQPTHGVWLTHYGFGELKAEEKMWFCDLFCMEEGLSKIFTEMKNPTEFYALQEKKREEIN